MDENILKVTVKDGCEKAFEKYCAEKEIFCKAYPIEILKTRYRAECNPKLLKDAVSLIIKIEKMPMVTLS